MSNGGYVLFGMMPILPPRIVGACRGNHGVPMRLVL